MGMKELTKKEIQWLDAFAKNHEFLNLFIRLLSNRNFNI